MKNMYIVAISLVLLIGMAAADTTSTAAWNIVGTTQLAQNYIGGHTFDTFQMNVAGSTTGGASTFAQPTTMPGQWGIDANGAVGFTNVGTTNFIENMVEGGLNWQNPSGTPGGWSIANPPDVATAYIEEQILNAGTLTVAKTFDNPYDWKLTEMKSVSGEGTTSITKNIGWWTNAQGGDATQVQAGLMFDVNNDGVDLTDGVINIDGRGAQPGLSTFPTVENVYILCPYTPPAPSSINTYHWNGQTDNPFTFSENVFINPQLPTPPV